MYVLERLIFQGTVCCWKPYASCGNRALLERVQAGQRWPEHWRIVFVPGEDGKEARTA